MSNRIEPPVGHFAERFLKPPETCTRTSCRHHKGNPGGADQRSRKIQRMFPMLGDISLPLLASLLELLSSFFLPSSAIPCLLRRRRTRRTKHPKADQSNTKVGCVSLSYGISLLVTAWSLLRVNRGLFNPVVTLGMVAAGALPPIRGLILLPMQILGAICMAAVVSCIIPGDISIVETKLLSTMKDARGVFLEIVCIQNLVIYSSPCLLSNVLR
jgi:hypothetical protein